MSTVVPNASCGFTERILLHCIPGHASIPGNVVDDIAACITHDSPGIGLVQSWRTDGASLVHHMWVEIFSSRSNNLYYHCSKVHDIHPNLTVRVSQGLPRTPDTQVMWFSTWLYGLRAIYYKRYDMRETYLPCIERNKDVQLCDNIWTIWQQSHGFCNRLIAFRSCSNRKSF